MCSSVVERCPDKTEVVGPIPTTRTIRYTRKIHMENNEIKTPWWHDGMIFFLKVSGWIAGPVLVVLVIETILEKYFEVPKIIFVLMMSFGFLFSIFGLVKESKRYIDKVSKSKNNEQL